MSGVTQMFHPHLVIEVPTIEQIMTSDRTPIIQHRSAQPDLKEVNSPLVSHEGVAQ